MTAVRTYSDDMRAAWDAYVDAHAGGTIFHRTQWKQAVERTFGHRATFLWAERDGNLAGVLPLFAVATLKGRALVSVPYGVYGGILADDPDAEAQLLEAARALATGLVSEVVPDADMDAAARRLVNDMLATSPLGLRLTKECLNASIDAGSLDQVIAMEDRNQVLCTRTDDFREGIVAFLQKRAPSYTES